MTTPIAWGVMNNVVWKKAIGLGHKNAMTIYSSKDWINGVALSTKDGIIHVLGNGEIVDENNVLNLNKQESDTNEFIVRHN
jgi:hypothetical protein